jgi:dTDP-4-dehydrorhamnose 3,5-epimerase
MELTPLGIEGAWLAESPLWNDDRGHFREWFKREEVLSKTGIDFSVEQANISESNSGAIRGIHFSLAQERQLKWVTCISGRILDVIVDIRVMSPTFGKHIEVNLCANDGQALLIGDMLGHGFAALEDNSKVSYLLSSKYNPEFEYSINPLDPALNINWPIAREKMIISEKDLNAHSFMQFKTRIQD